MMSNGLSKTKAEEQRFIEAWDVNAAIEESIRFAKLEEDPKWKEESLKRAKEFCEWSPFTEEEMDRLWKEQFGDRDWVDGEGTDESQLQKTSCV